MSNSQKIKHVYFQARRNGATQGCIAIYLRQASRLEYFSRGMFRLPTTAFLQLKFKNRFYLRNSCLNFSSDQKETSEVQATETQRFASV